MRATCNCLFGGVGAANRGLRPIKGNLPRVANCGLRHHNPGTRRCPAGATLVAFYAPLACPPNDHK
jgi:hypothetical protein